MKEGTREKNACDGDKDAEDKAEGVGGGDGALYTALILCAHYTGDDDVEAGGNAGKDVHEQADDGSRGTDGGDGLLACEVADDHNVGGVVECLKHTG